MPIILITTKETDSAYEFFGLKPLTTHYFYFNKKKQTSNVKQPGKKLGAPLITDENGALEIIYYLNSGISSDSPANASFKANNLRAGIFEVVVTNFDSGVNDLPDDYLNNSISSSKLVLNALNK